METQELLELLAEAVTEKAEAKKQATVQTAPLLFGSGGIFSTPGIEPDVVTAMVTPQGLMGELPKFPSVTEHPFFATITGVSDDIGNEAVNPCDDEPTGFMKGCLLTAQFGRLSRSTGTIEFDKVMLKVNSGVNTDLALRGRLLGLGDLGPGGLSEADALSIVTMSEMVQTGVRIERKLNKTSWQGTPANNTAGGGYKEFPGLDAQIATGQIDAETGAACLALDSDVKDFNLNPVGGSSPSIVEYLSMLEFFLSFNAEKMGLDPVTWVYVMRPELWFELSAIWPCQYNTNRCASAVIGSSTVFIDGRENVAERDRMRRGKTIDINGNSYRVITDTGIFEKNSTNTVGLLPGQFASSIYAVPLTITGAWPVTYVEHVDYRQAARDVALLRGTENFWTDRGIYSWVSEFEKWCYQLSVKTEQRIVLRTPQLAGRIDDVKYEPLQHLRDVDPDSPYHVDGGISLRPDPAVQAVWL